MGSTIHWGILGTGRIAKKFATDLKQVKDAKLLAVASRSEAQAKTFAKEFEIDHWHGSYLAMVENPLVDVVYIASPHPLHMEHALLCMNHGKAVLCEKPLAINARQVEEMIACASRNKVFMMEAMWTRFFPAIQKVLDLIKQGTIGEVKSVQADFGFHSDFDPESRLFDRKLGGGSLLDVGVYPLFLATLILGKPDQVKALSQFAPTWVDESTSIIMNYSTGAIALLSSSVVCNTLQVATIAGTKGLIEIKSPWYAPSCIKLITQVGRSHSWRVHLRFSFIRNFHSFSRLKFTNRNTM